MIALGIACAVLALALMAIALRQSGIKADAQDADNKRSLAEKQLLETAAEFAEYKRRTIQHVEDLKNDINQLEDDLKTCTAPGAVRHRLERLLSKAHIGQDRSRETELLRDDWTAPTSPGHAGNRRPHD